MRGGTLRGYLRRHWLTAVLIVLVALSEALILKQFPINRSDVSEAPQNSGEAQQATRPIPPLVFAWVPIRARLSFALYTNLRFIDRYHDTLNAVSTVAVAIFTATLWQTTKKLFKAGEQQIVLTQKSVDALVASERPHLRVVDPILVHENGADGRQIDPPNGILLKFRLDNFGKSPCFIQFSVIDKRITDELPPDIEPVDHDNGHSIIVIPGGENIVIFKRLPFTGQEWNDGTSNTNNKSIFVFGYIQYAGPNNDVHKLGFALKNRGFDEWASIKFVPTKPVTYWIYT